MDRLTPRMRELANRVLDHRPRQSAASGGATAPAQLTVAELRPHLENLMGSAGFRALLRRSIKLSGLEVPWLHTVSVSEDGTAEGVDELAAQVGAAGFKKGNATLLAVLLALLVAFVGEALTLRVIRDVWPGVSLTDLNIGDK